MLEAYIKETDAGCVVVLLNTNTGETLEITRILFEQFLINARGGEYDPSVLKDFSERKVRCTRCRTLKRVDEFYCDYGRKDGIDGYCKLCRKRVVKEGQLRKRNIVTET